MARTHEVPVHRDLNPPNPGLAARESTTPDERLSQRAAGALLVASLLSVGSLYVVGGAAVELLTTGDPDQMPTVDLAAQFALLPLPQQWTSWAAGAVVWIVTFLIAQKISKPAWWGLLLAAILTLVFSAIFYFKIHQIPFYDPRNPLDGDLRYLQSVSAYLASQDDYLNSLQGVRDNLKSLVYIFGSWSGFAVMSLLKNKVDPRGIEKLTGIAW